MYVNGYCEYLVRVKSDMRRKSAISRSQRFRLRFIDTVLALEGQLNRKRVSDVFGVSSNHVTNDLKLYKEICPGNVEYDVSSRSYRASAGFIPSFSGENAVSEYFSLLQAGAEGCGEAVTPLIGCTEIAETLPRPCAPLDASKLMRVTRAINIGSGLTITYQSLTEPLPKIRDVWPHALVFVGTRWHMRCYDGLKQEFRDFSLPRVKEIQENGKQAPRRKADDLGWQEKVVMRIVPNAELSGPQAEVVACQYGMTRKGKRWLWAPEVRKCLVPYMVNRYKLIDRGDPKAYPVVLANKEELRDLLFPEPE